MKIQTENIAFGSDEMVACPGCGKSNPPNRASCLYCGGDIAVAEDRQAGVKLNLRQLENWENGFNLVLIDRKPDADSDAAARYLRYEPAVFAQMLAAVEPFPLARIESGTEAEIAVKQLSSFGLMTRIVNDIDLKIGKPATRLRSLEVLGDGVRFTAFNTNEQTVVRQGEIVLIVAGRIVESKVESVEKGRKDKRKVLAESEISSDDLLMDVYTAGVEPGWRVTTKGFDFSSLGAEKKLLAVENIRLLLDKLRAFAPDAKIVEEYPEMMGPLSEVWDVERRRDFEGIKRTGVMRSGFSSVARTSNLEQFTKYSRLQRILL